MKELQYLNKYFVKYKYHFLLGIFITIVAQIFSLFTPKLISKSFKIIESYSKTWKPSVATIQNELLTQHFINCCHYYYCWFPDLLNASDINCDVTSHRIRFKK